MHYQQWLQHATTQLRPVSPSPRCDAEVLLSFVSGQSRTFLLAFGEQPLIWRLLLTLTRLLRRRQRGEPIAYLVEQREFWSLPLRVTPATFIPRPETELLVAHSLERLPPGPCEVVDLGTGSGAIALALAQERPDCRVTAVDRSAAAITVAQQNAQHLKLAHVNFLVGDWLAPLTQRRFSVVVSNPPYLDEADCHLRQGDVRFEPRSALVAAEAGLADLRYLIQHAWAHLLPGGWLLLEHGWQQGEQVAALLRQAGYAQITSVRDWADHPRIAMGQRPVH